jgi:tetratricopeptide (TPR) repeat protein
MFDPTSHDQDGVPNAVMEQLREAVESRSMKLAWQICERWKSEIDAVAPTDKAYALITNCLARLLDRHHSRTNIDRVQQMITAGESVVPEERSLADVARMQEAKGIILLHSVEFAAAITALELAMQIADLSKIADLRASTRYYLTRCHYKNGAYKPALKIAGEAKTLISEIGYSVPLALLQMTEAWLHFSQGELEKAEAILAQAERVLMDIKGDNLEARNCIAFRARIAREMGQYQHSIDLCREVELLTPEGDDGSDHVTARTLAHKAFAHILCAQTLPEGYVKENHLAQAKGDLRNAYRLAEDKHPRVVDRIYYYRAWLFAGVGQNEKALHNAKKAFDTASTTADYAIMAHSLILQAKAVEEPSEALELARQAVEIANDKDGKTDARRVCARSLIALAMAYLEDPFRNLTEARRLMIRAEKKLRESDGDYLRDELAALKSTIEFVARKPHDDRIDVRLGGIMETGLERGLQAIEEDAVQRMWERLGCNVWRTAKALKTSPTRVRGVLRRLRLIPQEEPSAAA